MRFKNKTVLVTGAGQNTGLGIATCFAREGAKVFLNDRTDKSVERAVATLHRRGLKRVVGVPADISVPAEVEAMFRAITARSKKLDVLVNNAAHLGVGPDFLDVEPQFFEAVIRVNLFGTFYVSQQAAKLMKQAGRGAIVNLASNTSKRAIRKRTAYIASKGGIDAMTLSMALDLAPHGIRVNSVAPGYIHSDRWDSLDAAQVLRRRANVPLGVEATPEDIARAVMFLASDEASNITGARLLVDGGCSAQHMPVDVDV
jgi:Dehydrogenases with different specificities (related to short-chain alcohol dehydrogenases)